MLRNSWGKKNYVFIEKGKFIKGDIVYWVNKYSRW